jgi:DNA-binding CsgD family transcriptional regulator
MACSGRRPVEGLTRREAQVLHLIGQALSTKEIAHQLGISARTAEVHIVALKRKLGLRNKVETALYAHGIKLQGQ